MRKGKWPGIPFRRQGNQRLEVEFARSPCVAIRRQTSAATGAATGAARVYVDRTVGGDCDHCDSLVVAVAGAGAGEGADAPSGLPFQPAPDRSGVPILSGRTPRSLSGSSGLERPDGLSPLDLVADFGSARRLGGV